MAILLLGLALFILVHVFTSRREARAVMVGKLGDGAYRGLYSLLSALGIVLIVYGFGTYRAGGMIPVWDPPRFFTHIAMTLLLLAMISLVAAFAPTGLIKSKLKHPMLVGVKAWALAHLLVNGDLGSILLFSSLLFYAVFARISLKRRPEAVVPAPTPFGRGDIIALVGGAALTAAFIFGLHQFLIGVPVISR